MSEASSVFTAAPHCSHYRLSSASCQHYGELYKYFITYYNVIILIEIIEIKCTINEMHLNHPNRPPPTPVHGKIVFHETGPWSQKDWGMLLYSFHPVIFT